MTTLYTLLLLANLARGGHALHESKYLDAYAQKRADYLCSTQTFSHSGWFSGQFIDLGHLKYNFFGENLAHGFQDEASTTHYDDMQDAFMASPEHKANIINKQFTAIGLGHACDITVEEFGGWMN